MKTPKSPRAASKSTTEAMAGPESRRDSSIESGDESSQSAESAGLAISDTALAWAAGFLDGEGCIHIATQHQPGRRSKSYRLGVHITQNDLHTLQHFRQRVGIHAPIYRTPRQRNHRRQCYTLNYTGHAALKLIKRLHPHLVRKQPEAGAVLDFWVEGRIGEQTGKPLDPEVQAIRDHYVALLKRLK